MTSWPSPALPARLAAARHLPLVGRRPELEALERLWVDVEAGRRQLVFVGGEPGAGKTRLMAEVAGALHDNDVAVLVGTCSLDAAIPYQPFAEMLDQLFTGVPAGSLHDALGDGGPQLRRLSAHAVRHRPELAEEVLEGGDTRVELFDAVAQLLATLARDRPVTLILDDLHWAQLPTLALLEHLVQAGHETRLLVLATFRTTAPDRSEEVAARVAELHRLEDVRRLDLAGLDTDAITEYVSLRSGLPLNEARPSAAVLRDRTGGNPFFLRETWADLERRGGVTALRLPSGVPASIGDTLAARIGGLGSEDQRVIELAAVLGDTFDLATLVAAGEADRTVTMAFVDAAMAVGLIEAVDADAGVYSFVHALTRQAVVDRMSGSRRSELHARAAQALERQPLDAPLVPRIAQHYLASHILGFHEEALRYSQQAGRLAERSLAFEDAAVWFERAAALPQCAPADRAEMLLAAAAATVRAGQFPRARVIYEQLESMADAPVRLAAAIGFEDATWRPGLVGPRAADLLSTALDECGLAPDDPRYIRALASLGRALALAGETVRARQVGDRAVELAEHLGDEDTLLHALTTAMWAGTAPDVAGRQATRTAAVQRMARARRNYEALGSAANFRATVSYLLGRPDDLEEAFADGERSIQATGQAYYRGVAGILAHSIAFLRGDFEGAEHWAQETFKQNEILGDQMTEGPYGVQTFMVRRERGALTDVRVLFDGREPFAGQWVPGLLALYTELGLTAGIRRALDHLMARDLAARTDGAQWPMELAFMAEGALSLGDTDALRALRPLLAAYGGKNLVCGTMIATFGSTERFLARLAAALGEPDEAERLFEAALAMDRRTRSVVHAAETLAHHARFVSSLGRPDRAHQLAAQARALAEPIGQGRVLNLLATLDRPDGPDGLTDRELEVLRLLAAGMSNQEIGTRLHISGNTAANHVRSILMKTGAANRTQAAIYAAQRQLV